MSGRLASRSDGNPAGISTSGCVCANGTVTDAEQAAYKKAQAAAEVKSAEDKAAELKAQTQVKEYKAVSTSGDVAQTASTSVDVSA